MISAVFFRWRQLLLFGRPQATQAGVHLHKFPAQLLPSAIGLNLALGFAACGRRGKGLGYRLALLFVSQPKIGSVPGILWAVAMAMGVATAPSRGRDRTGPEVAQLGDFPQQGSFLDLQGSQRIGAIRHMGHNRSLRSAERIIYARLASPKKANPQFFTFMSRTRAARAPRQARVRSDPSGLVDDARRTDPPARSDSSAGTATSRRLPSSPVGSSGRDPRNGEHTGRV
jgi:hypothetical protein